jgi:hypothetical protein
MKIVLVLVLVPVLVESDSRTRTRTRTKNKNAFTSGKTGNEGIQRILTKTVRRAGLILLFAEKLVPHGGTATSTIKPVS